MAYFPGDSFFFLTEYKHWIEKNDIIETELYLFAKYTSGKTFKNNDNHFAKDLPVYGVKTMTGT